MIDELIKGKEDCRSQIKKTDRRKKNNRNQEIIKKKVQNGK